MVDINLESMKDVKVKNVSGKCVIELENCTGEIIRITTTIQNAEAIHDELEKVTVSPEYWYEEMQKENDRLNQEVEDLKETLENINYQEAV